MNKLTSISHASMAYSRVITFLSLDSYPFCNSAPVIMVNKDRKDEAGLQKDPYNMPMSKCQRPTSMHK